ncbi:unnamed protein product [Acanthoscelides obtectus]|uniref:Uncharacterized protein n=1 Tax=Acanthoscelides obtectus TaxID=200917 RepID=A0A9P0P091_ACAOB|nr:unnamed protein product [Acanthoscelides obtectus]CAK1637362.1 hypothetical protein AOBTE_LOCUS9933 [Acanthoscelides obtectus]
MSSIVACSINAAFCSTKSTFSKKSVRRNFVILPIPAPQSNACFLSGGFFELKSCFKSNLEPLMSVCEMSEKPPSIPSSVAGSQQFTPVIHITKPLALCQKKVRTNKYV